MANSLKQDLTGKLVVLKESIMQPKYREMKWRLFQVDASNSGAGFGASPTTRGTALFGTFIEDGEKARMDGFDVERFATDEDLKEVAS